MRTPITCGAALLLTILAACGDKDGGGESGTTDSGSTTDTGGGGGPDSGGGGDGGGGESQHFTATGSLGGEAASWLCKFDGSDTYPVDHFFTITSESGGASDTGSAGEPKPSLSVKCATAEEAPEDRTALGVSWMGTPGSSSETSCERTNTNSAKVLLYKFGEVLDPCARSWTLVSESITIEQLTAEPKRAKGSFAAEWTDTDGATYTVSGNFNYLGQDGGGGGGGDGGGTDSGSTDSGSGDAGSGDTGSGDTGS